MLFFIDFIVALLAAAIIGILFFAFFSKRSGRSGGWNRSIYVTSFLLLFLGAWAGGVWLPSFGSTVWNAYWIPFFVAALLFGLFLIAFVPREASAPGAPDKAPTPGGNDQEREPEAPAAPQAIPPRAKQNREKTEERSVSLSVQLFIGALFILLILAILARYLWFYEEVLS